jgi:hypothetical protein
MSKEGWYGLNGVGGGERMESGVCVVKDTKHIQIINAEVAIAQSVF